ncbi:MAG: hypothetical protein V4663_13325 [Bacteroidota bacterium]
MDDKQKVALRKRWIETLFQFSHIEYQKQSWAGQYENHVNDYTEMVCSYFDDLNLDDGYLKFMEDGLTSDVEVNIWSSFHSNLNAYTSKIENMKPSDQEIIKDSQWIELTNLAKLSWDEFKKNLRSDAEKQMVSDIEKQYL